MGSAEGYTVICNSVKQLVVPHSCESRNLSIFTRDGCLSIKLRIVTPGFSLYHHKMIITPGEIHLWSAELSNRAEDLALLSVAEKQRADRFLVEHAREQFIFAHAAKRRVLAQYLNQAPTEIQFLTGEHDKPYLPQHAGIHFNISHSHRGFLLGISAEQELGVDIEYHKPGVPVIELAQRFFAQSEYESLIALPEKDQLNGFYRIWTRKEAFIKATGQGLSFGLSNFSVSLQTEGMDCLLTINGSAKLARQWSLGSVLYEKNDYSAAVAAQGEIKRLVVATIP